MTEQNLDPMIGRSFMGDGVATTLSGLFGGSGTTTYAENIGVMGYTRIYSTLAYLIAGAIAIGLGLLPKFGAIITAIPIGVLGGAVTVLFGMIAVLGARIWIEARVNFRDPVNLVTAAVALIVGTAELHAELGRLLVRRHRARHDRRDRHLPGAAVLPARVAAARPRLSATRSSSRWRRAGSRGGREAPAVRLPPAGHPRGGRRPARGARPGGEAAGRRAEPDPDPQHAPGRPGAPDRPQLPARRGRPSRCSTTGRSCSARWCARPPPSARRWWPSGCR